MYEKLCNFLLQFFKYFFNIPWINQISIILIIFKYQYSLEIFSEQKVLFYLRFFLNDAQSKTVQECAHKNNIQKRNSTIKNKIFALCDRKLVIGSSFITSYYTIILQSVVSLSLHVQINEKTKLNRR